MRSVLLRIRKETSSSTIFNCYYERRLAQKFDRIVSVFHSGNSLSIFCFFLLYRLLPVRERVPSIVLPVEVGSGFSFVFNSIIPRTHRCC